jgi:short subunit dehydrogenase-like uncharacterized protein
MDRLDHWAYRRTMTIAVYGAYGYTGALVAGELARRDLDMVLVGRDSERLRRVSADLGVADARVAGVDDPVALAAALHDCAAVINCAGPFTLSGEAVIRAAIIAGCHYLDIAGEQLYLQRIFDTLDMDAERAGVSVILAANDDGLPSDLLAHLTAERVHPVEELVIGLELLRSGGAPSRGTLRSALANIDTFTAGGLGYVDGQWDLDIAARRTSMMLPISAQPVAVVKFPLPGVVTVPRHVPARRVEGVTSKALVDAFAAVTPELIDNVPEGPPERTRRTAQWAIVVEALGSDGRLARGVVRGYDMQASTAAIAVEAARRLIDDGAPPGVLAPAQAYDPADFLNALAQHGVRWSIETSLG